MKSNNRPYIYAYARAQLDVLSLSLCLCIDLQMNVGFDDLFLWLVFALRTLVGSDDERRLTDIFNWNWHQ